MTERKDADGAEESFAREWEGQCIAFTYVGSLLKIHIDWGSRYKLFPSTKLFLSQMTARKRSTNRHFCIFLFRLIKSIQSWGLIYING